MVVGCLLIAEVTNFDTGAVGVSISATDETTWTQQLGILEAAKIVTTDGLRGVSGDGDQE